MLLLEHTHPECVERVPGERPMDRSATPMSYVLPERGEPRLARCGICGHQHACYVADRPSRPGLGGAAWVREFACLGCVMRAGDPTARTACAECVFPT